LVAQRRNGTVGRGITSGEAEFTGEGVVAADGWTELVGLASALVGGWPPVVQAARRASENAPQRSLKRLMTIQRCRSTVVTRYGEQILTGSASPCGELVDESITLSDPNRILFPETKVVAVVHEPGGAHPSPVQGYFKASHSISGGQTLALGDHVAARTKYSP
jgi:hypothetical protein